jgi:hypothetical protein
MNANHIRRLLAACLVVVGLWSAPAAAAVTLTVRPGSAWSDVALHPDGVVFVHADAAAVHAEVNGIERWRAPLPESVLHLRAAVDQQTGTVMAIAQGGQTGSALLISQGGVSSIGRSFGQNATAIGWSAAAGFSAYFQTSPESYAIVHVAGGVRTDVLMALTSQGFRDIVDGELRFGDVWFRRIIGGYSIHEPVERGGVYAGQWSEGDEGIGLIVADHYGFTAIAGLGFEPHLAVRGSTLYVAARTPAGAALAIITPPYPPAEAVDGTPPPPPPPPPPPQGVPDRQGVIRACLSPRLTKLGSEHETRAHSFAALNACVLELRQTDTRWGLLEKTGGDRVRDRAADIALYDLGNGTAQVVDVISDAEGHDGAPSAGWSLKDIRPVSQWKVPFGDVVMPPSPPPPVETPPDLDLKAALERVSAALRELDAKVNGILAHQDDTFNRLGVLVGEVDTVRLQLIELKARPVTVTFPDYIATIFGQRVTLRPVR